MFSKNMKKARMLRACDVPFSGESRSGVLVPGRTDQIQKLLYKSQLDIRGFKMSAIAADGFDHRKSHVERILVHDTVHTELFLDIHEGVSCKFFIER